MPRPGKAKRHPSGTGFHCAAERITNSREDNHWRQAEGIAAAKARGVRFGALPIVKPDDFPAVCREWRQGKLSARKAAQKLGVSHNTFLKWAKE